MAKGQYTDYTGRRNKMLVAIERVKTGRKGFSVWLFKCDCGTFVEKVAVDVLRPRKQNTSNCGCRFNLENRLKRRVIAKRKTYQKHCKKKNRDWMISDEQFKSLIQSKCFYCGFNKDLNGIDRIDSNKGYFIDNCVPCCWDCNIMKLDHSLDTFKNKVIQIYHYLSLYDKNL